MTPSPGAPSSCIFEFVSHEQPRSPADVPSAASGRYDLAFVDGKHTVDQVVLDFGALLPYLAAACVVAAVSNLGRSGAGRQANFGGLVLVCIDADFASEQSLESS